MFIELVGWDQTAESQRGFLPDAFDISAGFVLNQPSSIAFKYPKNGKNVSWLTDNDLPMIIMRVNGVEQKDSRFILRHYKIDDGAEEPAYEFEGWGYMTELNDVVVFPNILFEEEGLDSYGDWTRKYKAERIEPVWMIPDLVGFPNDGIHEGEVGEVMNRLINEAQNRGCLPKLIKTFNNTQTSNAASWTAGKVSPKYKAGTPLLEVLNGLVDRNLLDAQMDKYELILRNPGAIGTDYTVSDPNKALWYGRDVASGSEREVDKTGVFTAVLGTDDKNRVYESEDNHAPRSRWGRRETFKNVGDTKDADESKKRIADYRRSKGNELYGRTLNWAETGESGQLVPITGYGLGDKLYLDASPDASSPREVVRIRGFTLEVDNDSGLCQGAVSLGNIVPKFNQKIAKRIRDMTYGNDPGGAGGQVPADATVPNAPTSLNLTQSLFMDPGGQNHVMGTLTWTEPTLNTDGSPYNDYYENQVEKNVGGLGWIFLGRVDAGVSAISVGVIPQNTTVQFRVRAVDINRNVSAWATGGVVTTTTDTTVPGQPSTPTVTAPLSTLKVVWDGLLNGGGALPVDYLITEVHVSTTNNFTPSTGTQVGTMRGKGTFLLPGLTQGTVYYAKLINVDRTGNKSTASTQGSASATVQGLLSTDINDAAITAAKIQDGAVTQPKIFAGAVSTEKLTVAGFSEQLIANAGMEELASADNTKPAGWTAVAISGAVSAWGTDSANEYSGDRCAFYTVAGNDTARLYSTRPIPVAPGEVYYLAMAVKNSRAATGLNRMECFTGTTEAGTTAIDVNTTITNAIGVETGHTAYTVREGTITIPAGKTWLAVGVRNLSPGDSLGSTTYIDQIIVRKLIGDALIVNLTASKITAGTLTADVLLSSKFYTDVSPNARVELDGLGLRAYDDFNKNTIDISSLDGKGEFIDVDISGESNFGTDDPVTGEGTAQISPEGNASFKTVFADDMYVGGDSVNDLLNALPRGMVARSSKTLVINHVATGSTIDDLYEISADLVAGRVYRISMDPVLAESNPGSETGGIKVYVSDDGTRPTQADVTVGSDAAVMDQQISTSNTSIKFNKSFVPTVTGLHRFLFSLWHSSPGASDIIRILAGKELRIQIEDCGAEPPDTGINPGATLASTTTFTFPFSWSGSFAYATGVQAYNGRLRTYRAYGNTNPIDFAVMGFTDAGAALRTALAGYTINSIKWYSWMDLAAHWDAGGFVRVTYMGWGHGSLYAHNLTNTSLPATMATPTLGTALNPGPGLESLPRGQYLAHSLPLTFGQALRDNTAKGLYLAMPSVDGYGSNYNAWTELFGANNSLKLPYLKINATKY